MTAGGDQDQIVAAIRAQTRQQQWSVLPGGGWMITRYWVDPADTARFHPEQVWTTPVVGWRVHVDSVDPNDKYAEPNVYAEAITVQDGNVNLDHDEGRPLECIWHPDSSGGGGGAGGPDGVSTLEQAMRVIQEEHRVQWRQTPAPMTTWVPTQRNEPRHEKRETRSRP